MKPNESRKILVIDDDPDSRVLLKRALALEDYEGVSAENGLQGLELLKVDPAISLILMDLSMPGLSGADFVEELKRQRGSAAPPVILVSGWDRLEDKARMVGAVDAVRKPVDLDRLYEAIEKHLPRS